MAAEPFKFDYTDWIEGIWQRRVEFSDLVAYAGQPGFSSSLAAVLYQTWLKRNQTHYDVFAWFNLGVNLFSEKDFPAAQEAYEALLVLKPDFVAERFNLGLAYEQLNNAQAALAQWKQVEEIANPEVPEEFAILISALNSIGRLQETLREYQPACEALEKSLLLKPDQSDAIHHLIFMRQKQCRWPIYEPVGATTECTLRGATSALAMLNISDDPATQLEAALNYSQTKIPSDLPRLASTDGYRHEKIRIAYCSGDFCTHPVAMLTVELFEQHDKDKFEVYAFCWSPNDGSKLRQRIIQAVDHYIPIHDLNEVESARLIREHEIDILIDLHGQTNKARIKMLAHRPAPIQITYLGLPATTGLPCVDYVIADRFLIPEEHAGFYSEKLLYMPDIYQVSDRKREVSSAPTKESCGLPEDKFVFCSFNNNHKYTLEVFTTWMNILRRVPDSVLWLLADNQWAETNLRKQAESQGVDPSRLIFAKRAFPAEYLARYYIADLFLDTFPFNAGTTANDALWMELPVLTMSGRSFASRMAGALLTAAGLPGLITHDLEAYENMAVELGQNVKSLEALRQKLANAKVNSALFDTTRFARNLEAHYTELVAQMSQQIQDNSLISDTTLASKQLQKLKNITDVAIKAERFQTQGDVDGAIEVYRQWLKHTNSSDQWIAQFNMGVLLKNSGDFVGARKAFQAALKQKPDFIQAKTALNLMTNMPEDSNKENICLYTIAYSQETRIQADPDVAILDNCANERPDWREYWPIRNFILGTQLDANNYYGFLSPKFPIKTGLTGSGVIQFINNNPGADVYTFSPQADMGTFFLNVFEQGDTFDPGFLKICQDLLEEIGYPIDSYNIPMDSRQIVYSNFIVAQPKFWMHWLDICEKIFNLAETCNSTLAKKLNDGTSYPGNVPRKVFIIERIASLLLSTKNWHCIPYSTFNCAWSALPTSQLKDEAIISDALKLAFNESKNDIYIDAYSKLRNKIFGVNRPGFSGDYLS